MSEGLFDWRIILVRPRNPLNIGAAARAMANFGFERLAVVQPYGPVWRETKSAVGAEGIVRTAREEGSLGEALAEARLVVGTTSGQRRTPDRELISLDHLPAWLQHQARVGRRVKAALLFGSEKTGLSNESLSYCHALVRIPASARCPSMNLGQAVAVCCYELARTGRQAACSPDPSVTKTHVSPPASIQSLDHIFMRAIQVLEGAGYLKPKSRDAQTVKLRRLLMEQRLSSHDAKILGGVLAQVAWRFDHP